MNENKNNNYLCSNEGRSVRQSFYEVLAEVKEMAELQCFTKTEIQQANEICLIITEVMMLNPQNEIKIGGVFLSVEMVQEIYRQITNDHIKLVIDNFGSITYEIRNKKAYLRTALYNAIFENEAHWTNQVKKDFGY